MSVDDVVLARSDCGRRAAPGVYVARVVVNGVTPERRIVLLR